jgi:hypothetical protein
MATVRERFESKFFAHPISDCWLWMAAMSGKQPFFSCNGKPQLAYRVSWLLYRGEIPDGMDLCHRCDTPSCVNPSHLFAGTAKDNMADADNKGRIAWGRRLPQTRLNEKQVIEIRESHDNQCDLASRFGVSQSHISRIKTGARGTRKRVSWPS